MAYSIVLPGICRQQCPCSLGHTCVGGGGTFRWYSWVLASSCFCEEQALYLGTYTSNVPPLKLYAYEMAVGQSLAENASHHLQLFDVRQAVQPIADEHKKSSG